MIFVPKIRNLCDPCLIIHASSYPAQHPVPFLLTVAASQLQCMHHGGTFVLRHVWFLSTVTLVSVCTYVYHDQLTILPFLSTVVLTNEVV